MRRLLILAIMILKLLFTAMVSAGNFDVRLLVAQSSPQTLICEFQIRAAEPIGSGNLVVTYQPAAVGNPRLIAGQPDLPAFLPVTLTQPYAQPSLSVNFEQQALAVPADFSAYQTIAVVAFDITGNSIEPGFRWVMRPDLPNTTVLFAQDESHLLTIGSAEIAAALAEPDPILPVTPLLLPNFPNPFNPETTLRFYIPASPSPVYAEILIFNSLGAQVCRLAADDFSEGFHHIKWNATDDRGNAVASGVYLVMLKTHRHVQTRKVLLVK